MATAERFNPAIEMARDIARYTHDPNGFMRYAFGWGDGDLESSAGPRTWQANINAEIGKHLSNPETCYQPLFIAVASGHGIGKSAEVGMLINWAMSTCEDCKVVVTAGTGTQLATKTVPEIQKWFRRACNSSWWDINATSIRYRSEKRQANWRADAITWSDHNTEPFAGLHNLRKRILLVFDEASAISDKVYEVAEGAMTDEDTEIIWIAFGNPTQNTGRFRECFGKFKHRWKPFQIDSRTVEGTNKAQIEKWIADYGEDSDFVRVRVRGEFPRAGSSQFIPSDIVAACRKYRAVGFESLPKILSVDVARFGDDQAVIGTRQGRKARILGKYRGQSTIQLAERVIEFIKSESPDATIIDGIGVGAGVVDQLRYRGYTQRLFEYAPGLTADNPQAYFNRRSELWGLMRDWLQAGAEIPDDPELASDLCGPEYYFSPKSQIQLEGKDDMKARGLSSPDCADMLAMTFQVKIAMPQPAPKPEYRYPGQTDLSWMGV
jgi:Helicase